MALPNLFIIGAAKAGTTSLHNYLDLHPEIGMSSDKEPNYFSGPENGIPYPMGRVATAEAYERLFDPAYRVRGESSVSYANHPRREGVPKRIKDAVPGAKFIYLVRDPIDRLVSHYHHRVSWMGETRPMEEAFDLDDPADVGLCPGFYGHQLQCYLEEFPADRVMVIDQARLLGSRAQVLREVFAFVGVDEDFTSPAFTTEFLKGSERRVLPPAYVRIVEPLKATWPLSAVPRDFRRRARRGLEGLLWHKVEKQELDDGLRAHLVELYAEDASRLRELTGMPFEDWGV